MLPGLASVVALVLAAPPAYVEVRSSAGALTGEGGRPPRWDGLRLELELENRLGVSVSDVIVDVALVESGGESPRAIPGWTFRDQALEAILLPQAVTRVDLVTTLPARRRSPAAEDLAYDAQIQAYRVDAPNLELAFMLLASSRPSDQRAALDSFHPDEEWPAARSAEIGAALARALATLPRSPSATDALRMLLAVRSAGILGSARPVEVLLHLPDRLEREVWGRAVLELASQMVVASAPNDPRLRVLPRWARQVSTLLRVNARDAVAEVAREAILRIGPRSVPTLVRAAGAKSREVPGRGVRARAARLLKRMGRATPAQQLRLRDPEARRAVMAIFAATHRADAVPALVRVLTTSDRSSTRGEADALAAERALDALGPMAVLGLAEALGAADDAVRPVLRRIGQRAPQALAEVARTRFDFDPSPYPRVEDLVDAIAERSQFDRRSRLEGEIADAMGLGAKGAYRAALARLDAVYEEDPELYMRNADPIARIYVALAETLLERGDFTAALAVLADGQSVRRLPEAEMRMTDAHVALAQGYLSLGHLDRARQALEDAPIASRADVVEVSIAWHEEAASRALSAGQVGDARRYVDRARSLAPNRIGLRLLDRRVSLAEHLSEVLVLALTLPAMLLAMLLSVRRWLERRRVEALARALDAEDAP
ncbi:MAG: hypothetical protein AAFZ18_27705 [Myxococcota bacterium]